jgi:plastocyanin
MRLALVGLTILLVSAACRQTTESPGQLTVSLQANTTVVPRGDTVTFIVNAAGNNLFGAVIDYGDQSGDQYATGGALSARITFKHVYDAAGNYTVKATVTDAVAGEREATIVVVVN